MKKIRVILRVLLVIIIILAVLAAGLLAAVYISRNHRSDPAKVVRYETDNPFITGRTQISAHRSGGGIAPEETLMAFRNCAENPEFSVDVYEFDLHITADDQLVLLHDDTLDRTSDCEAVFGETGVRPENKTLAELKQLNMGAKFVAPDGSMPYAGLTEVPDELRILSLPEVLDYLSALGDFSYIIEVKNDGELGKRAVDVLYAELVECGLLHRTAFGTFSDEIGAYVSNTYPDFARGTTVGEVVDFYIAALTDDRDYVPPCSVLQLPFCEDYMKYGINMGTAQVINYAHSHNLALQYWTVNDPEDMAYLISMGADCIMTDYPDVLYRVAGEMA